MAGVAFLFIAAVAFAWPQPVAAEAATGQTAAPSPSWARSIEVVDDGAPVMLGPSNESARRGTVGAGTRLGFTRRVFGEGCSTLDGCLVPNPRPALHLRGARHAIIGAARAQGRRMGRRRLAVASALRVHPL
ncbi:MAG: hypothetical protein JRJ24_03325 [Deltaproteobacteria bacterium]|nr:hypothetical protein [Deltaproteobacteria bacterium]